MWNGTLKLAFHRLEADIPRGRCLSSCTVALHSALITKITVLIIHVGLRRSKRPKRKITGAAKIRQNRLPDATFRRVAIQRFIPYDRQIESDFINTRQYRDRTTFSDEQTQLKAGVAYSSQSRPPKGLHSDVDERAQVSNHPQDRLPVSTPLFNSFGSNQRIRYQRLKYASAGRASSGMRNGIRGLASLVTKRRISSHHLLMSESLCAR